MVRQALTSISSTPISNDDSWATDEELADSGGLLLVFESLFLELAYLLFLVLADLDMSL